MKLQFVPTGGGLKISATTFQGSRLRVNHFMTHEGDRFTDEIEQRRECKAEFHSSCCCGSRATTLNQNTQKYVLLPLNPDSYQQILAFLHVIQTKLNIAEALNQVPNTYTIYYSRTRAM